jgi:hypothetical protein
MRWLLVLLFFGSSLASDYNRVTRAVSRYQDMFYNYAYGLWNCNAGICSWWESARSLDMLLDYAIATARLGQKNQVADEALYIVRSLYRYFAAATPCADCLGNTTVTQFVKCGFEGYYDDEGWWALALVKAYEFTQLNGTPDDSFLAVAQEIHEHMSYGWDSICGGIHWMHCDSYVASISLELFLLLSTKLHEHTGNVMYWNAATVALNWFVDESGLLGDDWIVTGGKYTLANCTNDNGPGFTYDQGVLLPALAYLGQDKLAQKIIDAAIFNASNKLVFNGVLTDDYCERNNACDEDQKMFKGIYLQFLKDWYLLNDYSAQAKRFILSNADAVYSLQNNDMFPLIWIPTTNAPIIDYYTTTSGVTALVASLFVQ